MQSNAKPQLQAVTASALVRYDKTVYRIFRIDLNLLNKI